MRPRRTLAAGLLPQRSARRWAGSAFAALAALGELAVADELERRGSSRRRSCGVTRALGGAGRVRLRPGILSLSE